MAGRDVKSASDARDISLTGVQSSVFLVPAFGGIPEQMPVARECWATEGARKATRPTSVVWCEGDDSGVDSDKPANLSMRLQWTNESGAAS